MRLALVIAAVGLLTGGPALAARPECAGPVEISGASVMRVEASNDAIVLQDGRAVRLEGVRMPHAAQDRAPRALTDQAHDALSGMALGNDLVVTAIAPKEDRYDRVRGQVFVGGNPDPWLQVALLKRGLARVDIAPDRTECAATLYAAEATARAARVGLWSSPAYGVRAPDGLGGLTGTFQIVQGTVLTADMSGGRAYLDFGKDWHTDFTVTVAPEDMAYFRDQGVDPRLYAGKTIRVRGIVQQFHGPEIEIANPEQIEVLP